MHAIRFYRQVREGEALLEYNFYDNGFAPSNLVVRKVWMAMLRSVQKRLTHLEIEYNDKMLLDRLGKRAVEVLRFLGASRENVRENQSNGITYSRTFRAELTAERYQYFYQMMDVSEFSHLRLQEGERDRTVFYFGQYLLLTIPAEEEEGFYHMLDELQVPYRVEHLTR